MVSYKLFANVNPLEPNNMVLVKDSRKIMDSSEEGKERVMRKAYDVLVDKGYSVALYKITEECVCTHKAVSLV